jgi:hypothetical protein
MNKVERCLALVYEIIANNTDEAKINALISELLDIFDQEFECPGDEYMPVVKAILMKDGTPGWNTIPLEYPEAIWPVVVMRGLVREYNIPISNRLIPHFDKFTKRYERFIIND